MATSKEIEPTAIPSRAPPPRVPDGVRVYAVGDVHGRADLLSHLLRAISEDAAGASAGRRIVVFLGDYVDRGSASRGVLERLVEGPPEGFEWVCLKGNHEDYLLRFLDDVAVGPAWLANGGVATVESYRGRALTGQWAQWDLRELQAALVAALPPAHLAFLRTLESWHVEGDYFFTHAGVRPGVPLDAQDPEDLMWIRGAFLRSRADHGKIVVHGHSITARPEVQPNRIGIDTGAFASGRLTALVLEGSKRAFLGT